MRVANQLGAFAFFLADRQQPDARAIDAERNPRVHRTHGAELQQMRRPALDIGADVEQDAEPVARRNRRRERGPIDARQHAERAVGRQHRRPRVTGADERRGLSTRHRLCGRADRRTRLAPQRGGRRLGHADDVGRVEDADAELVGVGMSRELGANHFGRARKQKPEIEMTRGSQGAVDDAAGSVVAPHRVYGDADHGRGFRLRTPGQAEPAVCSLKPVTCLGSSTARTCLPR